MTNQEEIKQILVDRAEVYLSKDYSKGLIEQIWLTLHLAGVVIKVDRELPEALYDKGENLDPQWVEEATKQDMLKAGYVAVEELI